MTRIRLDWFRGADRRELLVLRRGGGEDGVEEHYVPMEFAFALRILRDAKAARKFGNSSVRR